MATEALLVFSTFPNLEEARRVARLLVEEQLAACVNLVPAVESHYRWEGKFESASEVLALIKTTAMRFAALQSRLESLHPYDLPEIVAVPITAGLPGYLQWILRSTEPGLLT